VSVEAAARDPPTPVAMRKNINGMLESPVTIFWNIEKK
jgi:hypothetical protein